MLVLSITVRVLNLPRILKSYFLPADHRFPVYQQRFNRNISNDNI